MSATKVLMVGDVFGRPGRNVLKEKLPGLVEQHQLDLVVVNGENAAGGKGITPEICEEFFGWGVDVITSGNHIRDQKIIDAVLLNNDRLLRPLNYPAQMPGKGVRIQHLNNGKKVAIVNLIGNVHMGDHESPFVAGDRCVAELEDEADFILVDFHAEASSEKRALGWFLNGKVAAVVGTHTHVQTADEEVLSGGTAYISDLGMTGPHDSVIGLRTDLALKRFIEKDKRKFEPAKGDPRLCGAVIEINDVGKAVSIERIQLKSKH